MGETDKVVIERVFEAPRERVWQAWTDPEEMKKWWGPKDFTAPEIKMDFRVGGKYLYCMHGPAGTEFDVDMWSSGTYQEIVPLKKIVCTDSFSDKDGNIVSASEYGMEGVPLELKVTFEFEDTPDGKTKLTLTHEGMAPQHADDMTQGWNQTLDKLAESLKD